MGKSKQTWPSNDEAKSVRYIVHQFNVGDVEDPDLIMANAVYEWQSTEKGKYVMSNSAPKPCWNRDIDHNTYGYRYTITAYFTPKQLTYFKLRFE